MIKEYMKQVMHDTIAHYQLPMPYQCMDILKDVFLLSFFYGCLSLHIIQQTYFLSGQATIQYDLSHQLGWM